MTESTDDIPDSDENGVEEESDPQIEVALEHGFALADGKLSLDDLGIEPPSLGPPDAGDDEVLHSLPIKLPIFKPNQSSSPLAERIMAHPEYERIANQLVDEVSFVSHDLHAALRQDVVVHRAVLERARTRLREARNGFNLAIDRWEAAMESASDPSDGAIPNSDLLGALEETEQTIVQTLQDNLLRKLERYYESDPAIIGLEQALSRLEILPVRMPTWLDIELEELGRPWWKRVISGNTVHLPLGRALTLAVVRSDLHTLVGYFPRILSARRRIRRHIASLVDEATEHIARVRDGIHNKTPAPSEDDDDPDAPIYDPSPRALVRRMTRTIQSLSLPIADLREDFAQLDEAVTDRCNALAGAAAVAANHTRFADRSRLVLKALALSLPYGIKRRISAIQGATVHRQQLRVLYHPTMRNTLAGVRRTLASSITELREQIDADMDRHVEILAKLEQSMKASAEKLDQAFEDNQSSGRWEKRRVVRVETRRQIKKIYNVFEKRVIAALWVHYGADPLAQQMQRIREEIRTLPETVPEKLEISFVASVDRKHRRKRLTSRSSEVEIRMRDIVDQWLSRHRSRGVDELDDELQERRSALVKSLQELWNVVRYNLEGSVAEADEHLDPRRQRAGTPEEVEEEEQKAWAKCQELAVGGLERSVLRLRDILEKLGAFHQKVVDRYNERFALTEKIADDAAAAATFRGALRFAFNELKLRGADLLHRARLRSEHWFDVVKEKAIFLYKQAASRSGTIRKILNLPEEPAAAETKPSLEKVDQSLEQENEKVPPVYRRLFAREPLEVDEFMVAREQAFKALDDAWVNWTGKKRTSVLLYGDPGTGKRSLLNCGLDRFGDDAPILRCTPGQRITTVDELTAMICTTFGFGDTPDTLEALIQRLLEAERKVVVLDHLHRIFIRRIGGFTALNALIFVISRTNHHHLWLASVEGHSYALLQRLFRISDAFTHVIPSASLSSRDLQAAILTRHDMSGFKLLYSYDESKQSRFQRRAISRARTEEEKNRVLAQQFFRNLRSASDGNIYVAIAYWLNSVAGVEGDDALKVNPVEPLRVPALDRLTQDHQFALCALLQHGDLNALELAEIFNWDVVKSRLALQYFHHRRLTDILDEEEVEADLVRYKVNILMLKPIVGLLSGKHIVYWQTP